jgi:hypothetical protein
MRTITLEVPDDTFQASIRFYKDMPGGRIKEQFVIITDSVGKVTINEDGSVAWERTEEMPKKWHGTINSYYDPPEVIICG